MSVLPLETKAITFFNIALLLLVAIVPYLLNSTQVVNPTLTPDQASAIKDFSSILFALNLAGIMFMLAAFAHIISIEEKKLVAPELATLFKNGRNRMAILAVVMAISIAPQFWQIAPYGIPLRIYLWYLPLISYWVGRVLRPDSRTYTLSKTPTD